MICKTMIWNGVSKKLKLGYGSIKNKILNPKSFSLWFLANSKKITEFFGTVLSLTGQNR